MLQIKHMIRILSIISSKICGTETFDFFQRFDKGAAPSELLISKPVLCPAVRAIPGNAVAGHPPDIFIHTRLADGKPAPAGPGEHCRISAAMAGPVFGPTPALSPLLGIMDFFMWYMHAFLFKRQFRLIRVEIDFFIFSVFPVFQIRAVPF